MTGTARRGAAYRRPTWVRRAVVNPVARFLVVRGLAGGGQQNLMRVLRVAGRRTGRLYDVPIRVAIRRGRRYVVSLLGDAEWARNLRAAGEAGLVDGPHVERVLSVELGLDERTDFLRWYVTVPAHSLSARAGLKVDPRRPTPDALGRAARDHPVFRLTAAPDG